jgi:glucose/mannose-6-phosphate isomerase
MSDGALDRTESYAIDSLGLFDVIGDSVAIFDRARAGAEVVDLAWPSEAIHNVAIAGMGGSGIAGELAHGVWRERLRQPVSVLRDYYVPGWVGEHTLVVLSSYSGETEETLTVASQATERNALCVAITSGGKLGTFYRDMGVPVIDLPGGLQPRAAILELLVPLVVVLGRMGVIAPPEVELDDARQVILDSVAALDPSVPTDQNLAKQVALGLMDSVPLIWGAEATSAVAQRWKCQINENAEMPAYWSVLPEADHNEICAYGDSSPVGRMTQMVLLRDPHHHRQVARRIDLSRELIAPAVAGVLELAADGNTPFGRMLDLVMLGDYVSLYLAIARGVDPGPVDMIGRLKTRLAETGYGRAPDQV